MKSTIEWFDAKHKEPECDAKPDSFGTPVLIWPPHNEGEQYALAHVAYFGRRVTNKPSFYIYGRTITPQFWAYIPEPHVTTKAAVR